MQVFHVNLFGRRLVTVATAEAADGLCSILNSGALVGVDGDPAAYEEARMAKPEQPIQTRASYEEDKPSRRRSKAGG